MILPLSDAAQRARTEDAWRDHVAYLRSVGASFDDYAAAMLPKWQTAFDEVRAAFLQFGETVAAAIPRLVDFVASVDWAEVNRVRAIEAGIATEVDIRDVYFADGDWWVRLWNHRRIRLELA